MTVSNSCESQSTVRFDSAVASLFLRLHHWSNVETNFLHRALLLIDEMATAVLLPARFVAFAAEWFFFAEADHIDAASVDGSHRQYQGAFGVWLSRCCG